MNGSGPDETAPGWGGTRAFGMWVALRRHWLLGLGICFLSIAWLFGNPPASAPDEPEHYIRAVSLGRGELLGSLGATGPMAPLNHSQAVLLAQITRSVTMPAGLGVPQTWFCTVIDHSASAGCLQGSRPPVGQVRQATYVGSYQPFAYLLAAPFSRLGRDPVTNLYLARLGFLVLSLPLLLLAVAVNHSPESSVTTLGMALATTPMVVFTSVVVSPSALEVAAGVCLWAAVARICRDPVDSGLAVPALGLAGFALGIGRPLGALWVAFAGIGLVILLGREGLSSAWRAHRRGLVTATTATLAGLVPNLAWQFVVLPPAQRSAAASIGFLGPSIVAIPETIGEVIGVFGWQDTLMPRPWYAVWGLLVVALIAMALMRGTRRELRRFEAILLIAAMLVVLVSAVVLLPTGYSVQGRYLLPALSAIPLLAAEMVRRAELRRRIRAVVVLGLCASVGIAAVQFVAWYANAHRYAVGLNGPWYFLSASDWQPPLGWLPWLTLAVTGSLTVGAAVLPTKPGIRAADVT